ncbi:MAG: helix-turn-helix transcriptional regulator [Clostridia bacterium]|nr:helix-turn-helix transcriptional regulator [Clostridia bacterium]
MENEIKTFCNNVKKLREIHKISKQQMAKILGISVRTLTSIENGIIPPRASVDIIFNLCSYFPITPNELFAALI